MSKEVAIKAENISKLYQLGQVGTGTLSHDLKRWWAKTRGQGRRVRLYLEYHDGYSTEGQFCRIATNYLSMRLTYGF